MPFIVMYKILSVPYMWIVTPLWLMHVPLMLIQWKLNCAFVCSTFACYIGSATIIRSQNNGAYRVL